MEHKYGLKDINNRLRREFYAELINLVDYKSGNRIIDIIVDARNNGGISSLGDYRDALFAYCYKYNEVVDRLNPESADEIRVFKTNLLVEKILDGKLLELPNLCDEYYYFEAVDLNMGYDLESFGESVKRTFDNDVSLLFDLNTGNRVIDIIEDARRNGGVSTLGDYRNALLMYYQTYYEILDVLNRVEFNVDEWLNSFGVLSRAEQITNKILTEEEKGNNMRPGSVFSARVVNVWLDSGPLKLTNVLDEISAPSDEYTIFIPEFDLISDRVFNGNYKVGEKKALLMGYLIGQIPYDAEDGFLNDYVKDLRGAGLISDRGTITSKKIDNYKEYKKVLAETIVA